MAAGVAAVPGAGRQFAVCRLLLLLLLRREGGRAPSMGGRSSCPERQELMPGPGALYLAPPPAEKKPIVPSKLYRAVHDSQLIGVSGYSRQGHPVFSIGVGLSTFDKASVVKPLLQERTRRKVQVLQGCGRDEMLKVMDYSSLPHFCRREGSGSSRRSDPGLLTIIPTVDDLNYTERTETYYIVNALYVFSHKNMAT